MPDREVSNIMKNTEEQSLEHIIRRMQTDKAVDAPADALRYVKNLYRTRMTEPTRSVFQRVLAVMRVDLGPNRAAFGERSGTAGQARQILFESENNAVDLRVKASGTISEIRGQILGENFENGEIEITNDSVALGAHISETSNFTFSKVPNGKYSVTIRARDKEIYIEELILE